MVVNSTGIRVFVYGSLKRGCGNHSILEKAEYLGRCTLRGKYQMLNLKYYPGLVCNSQIDNNAVLGEVYKVTKEQLDVLDMIEGHPDYYCRTKVTTPWKSAWCYFLPDAYIGRSPPVDPTSGVQVWLPNKEEVEYVSPAPIAL